VSDVVASALMETTTPGQGATLETTETPRQERIPPASPIAGLGQSWVRFPA
jgi:hypothetical protein